MLMGQGRGVMEERQIGSGCDDIYFHGWQGVINGDLIKNYFTLEKGLAVG